MDYERMFLLAADEMVLILVGLVVCYLGYLIWIKEKVSLLAGMREKTIADKKGLGEFMGKWLVAVGFISASLPLLIRMFGTEVRWVYTAFIFLVGMRIFIKLPKFYRQKKK